MCNLSHLDLETEYRTGESDLVRDFYIPCLDESCEYIRAVGYFRSTVYLLIWDSVINFVQRGGRIRIICSPELSAEDIEAVERGYIRRGELVARRLSEEAEKLVLDVALEPRVELLATLIAAGVLDIKVAVRTAFSGLYHEKIGVFADNFGHAVSFKGSANETWSGWYFHGNLESLEVFCSWRGGSEEERVAKHHSYLQRLWNDRVPGVSVLEFPEAARAKVCTVAKRSLDEMAQYHRKPSRQRRQPLPHQLDAIAQWRARGRRGVLQHATGSGKTFTAIIALQEHLRSNGPAIVVVPSRLLLAQWSSELRTELPDATILTAGAGNNLWRRDNRLEAFTSAGTEFGPRIVLATMQTACKREFRDRVHGGDHLLIIADEVHQAGSRQHSEIFQLRTGPRLGLSATPQRYGDPDGTAAIFRYFGDVVPPAISLEDAIRLGRLVPYEYHPHVVHLSDDESNEWKEITRQINAEIRRSPRDQSGTVLLSEHVKLLLIRRARIAKRARAKIGLAISLLSRGFKEADRWLVYCEDIAQLRSLVSGLRDEGLVASEYYSEMPGDAPATLGWFRRFGGILVSIRCLDEGVDIPEVSHALILASSQNPRQFIQRRGRVLRTAPGKQRSVIHDAIVVPSSAEEDDQFGLARAELARAFTFANSALNRAGALQLLDMAADVGVDISNLVDAGLEDQEAWG